LLGREQIADAPTAVCELLKNAIDAAASNAKLHYSTLEKRLVLSDNGLGMRTTDVMERWLVIATDSKRGPTNLDWLRWATESQRRTLSAHRPLGEKGIGRLAVSTLGRAVVVWTRWGNAEHQESTLLFVHWDIFRHPRLSLDKIQIPFRRIEGARATTDDIVALMTQAQSWLQSTKSEWTSEEELRLFESISGDLATVFPKSLANLELDSTIGTTFAILGTTDEVDELFKEESPYKESIEASEGLKLLLGFSDPFSGNKERISLQFIVDGKEPRAGENFWTENDFAKADHEIDLRVDADGYARGTIRRFKQNFKYEFQVPLPTRASSPGPFSLHVGYVEGTKGTSHLQPDEHNAYSARLKAFGALYVYRDGIRVLPYGRVDHDFLAFEERRSHNAGRYFFSHRRMFGAVYLDGNVNSELRDKAGREGFIKNAAYRGFTQILKGIFIDLAQAHFGSDADRDDKNDADNVDERVRLARKRAERERQEFLESLEGWLQTLQASQIELTEKTIAARAAVDPLRTRSSQNLQSLSAARVALAELSSRREQVLDQLGMQVGPMVRLSRTERERFDAYLSARQHFEFDSLKAICTLNLAVAATANELVRDELRASEIARSLSLSNQAASDSLDAAFSGFVQRGQELLRDTAPAWRKSHQELLHRKALEVLASDDPIAIANDAEKTAQIPRALAEQRRALREVILPFWHLASRQLNALEDTASFEFELGALHRAMEQIEDRLRTFSELAQLGLIVESLDHEFNVLFASLKSDIKKLAGRVDPSADNILAHFKLGFESLEAKLRFLSPLYRRRWGSKGDLLGAEIRSFADKLFTFSKRNGVEISYTEKFIAMHLSDVNKPIILAGVANLISNSLYWTSRSPSKPQIRFSTVPDGFAVSDSGPGVPPRDRERIFEPFFGRRPMGRGLGLYITKTNFVANNLSITVPDSNPRGALNGACFLIRKIKQDV